MIRIGIVGIGFMGWIHWLGAKKLKDAQVTAICSRDPKKRSGDWTDIRGNFGPPGEQVDLSEIKTYDSLDAILADDEIELIDICNPTQAHPQTVIQSLNAGKHVLVEKCIALDPKDADAMLDAAAKAGKMLMVAHVLPFFPEFQYAAEVIQDGRYGKLIGGHFKRIISKPDWSSEIADAAKTGGPAVDLHIHDTHFIGLVCGVPKQVFSTGIVENDTVMHVTTQYLYGLGGPCVSCSSGALCQKGREFVHGYEIYLEKATLVYESGPQPLTVLTEDGKITQPEIPGSGDPTSAFTAEIQTAVDAIKSGVEPKLLSGKLARDALVLCHKECESVKTGKAVAVD